MKKSTKRAIKRGIIFAVLLTAIVGTIGACADNMDNNESYTVETETVVHSTYPLFTVVVNVDKEDDVVVVETHDGEMFEFDGVGEWEENNICSMIMDDNGTPNDVTDDIIIVTKYDGTF